MPVARSRDLRVASDGRLTLALLGSKVIIEPGLLAPKSHRRVRA